MGKVKLRSANAGLDNEIPQDLRASAVGVDNDSQRSRLMFILC